MKKLFLISSVVAGLLLSVASAKALKYELTPTLGTNTPENSYDLRGDNNILDTHFVSGFEFQFNQPPIIHPELSFSYALAKYDNSLETNIMRMAINGVYEYKTEYLTPSLKAGFGLNMMSEPKDYYTSFIDIGTGLKFNMSDNLALKTELIYLSDYNNGGWNSNITFLVGLTISFGATTQKQESITYDLDDGDDAIITNLDDEEKKSVEIKDDSNSTKPTTDMFQDDLVLVEDIAEDNNNSNSFRESKIEVEDIAPKVAKVEQVINNDSDEDGIVNSIDECPNTPLNSYVNRKGCVKKIEKIEKRDKVERVDKNNKNIIQLNIKFKYKSFELTQASKEEVLMLAEFLNNNSTYNAKILGYTDNKGSRGYNKKLSQKRANVVKTMLIKNKVSSRRVFSIGMGEVNPIADNDTENGRAKNRRIEVELIKK